MATEVARELTRTDSESRGLRLVLPGSVDNKKVENPFLPDFDLDWVKYAFRTIGKPKVKRFFDGGPEVHGLERARNLIGSDKKCLYVFGPHRTQFDYVMPNYVILDNDLPYLRTITGINLKNPLIRAFGFKLEDWGVIWKKRKGITRTDGALYLDANLKTYCEEGLSTGGWPEGADPGGARDRSSDLRIREFPAGFFKPALRVRRKLGEPVYVVPIAFNYEKRPEDGFWDFMDNGPLGKFGYYVGDVAANLSWRYLERDKPAPRVMVGEPSEILELAGKGARGEVVERLAKRTRSLIEDALKEIR